MAAATNTTLGEIKLAGDLAGNNDANAPALTSTGVTAGSYTLPTITVDVKGRITNAVNGTASSVTSMVPLASTTQRGIAQVGSGLIVDGSGVIGIPPASTSVRGGFRLASGGGLIMNSDAELSLDLNYLTRASTSEYGVVRILSGGGITVTDGVISTTAIPTASATVSGTVQLGTGFLNSSTLTPKPASTTEAGVFKLGVGFRMNGSGQLELDPTFVATTTTPGLVKLGSNIVNNSGVIDVFLDKASPTSLGLIRVGAGLSIDGAGILSAPGAVSPPVATTTSLGVAQIGSNINVSSGVISIPQASTTNFGAVRVGTLGVSVAGGVISLVPASNTTYGAVVSGNDSEISITSGSMTLGSVIARKNVANTWTGTQTSALVDRGGVTGSVTIDLAAGNVQIMTLVGNTTFASPINGVPGGVYHIVVKQGTTGYTAMFDSAFKFNSGFYIVDTTADSYTIISIVCINSGVYLSNIISGF